VTSLIFFFLTFFATVSDNVQIGGGGNVLYNGPFSIAQTLCIMGLFAMFLVVNFVASTATRNDTSKMSEILYSKPINPISYQLGRFLGSFAMVASVFAFVPLGIFVGTTLGGFAGWVDAERLGDTHLTYYFTAYCYLALPTLLVLSCMFYAVAILFRSMMAVYLVAVGFFILYNVAGQLFSEPEYRNIVALADPFALNTFAEVTRYWTMYDKNNTTVELSGLLLQNRIIWLFVGLVMMVLFGGVSRKISLIKVKADKKEKQTVSQDTSHILTNRINFKSQGIKTAVHMALRVKFEIKQVIFSAPFLVLGVFTMFALIAPLVDPSAMFGTPNWPITQTMVELVSGSTALLMLIVLAYYSAEIVWRERNSGMGDIVDSMPVSNVTFWLSKIIAISLVLVLLYVFGTCVAVLNQMVQGYNNYELTQYAVRLGYINLLPLIMTAVLAFFLQVISPNKYVGMLLFVLYIISTLVLGSFGFSHSMFQFSNAPQVLYSDINQYGHFLTAHGWYMLYWGGLSVVLSGLTFALWHRGPVQSLKLRIKRVGYYLGNAGKTAVAFGLVTFVAAGSYIHYNTRVLNEYVIVDDVRDIRAEYEKTYVQYKNDHIPTVIQTHAKVDIYPKERRIKAVADITVKNTSDKPISRFLVTQPRHSAEWGVMIEGGEVQEFDEKYDTGWFVFDEPLQPGESRTGQLSAHRKHQGFSETNDDVMLVENGTFIDNFNLFPTFGYRQLTDRHERRKRDLEPVQRANKLEESQFYHESFFGKGVGFIDFEATISTDVDQFAIAPGYVQSEKVENGRSYG